MEKNYEKARAKQWKLFEKDIFKFTSAAFFKMNLTQSLCQEDQFSFIFKLELINITKISH